MTLRRMRAFAFVRAGDVWHVSTSGRGEGEEVLAHFQLAGDDLPGGLVEAVSPRRTSPRVEHVAPSPPPYQGQDLAAWRASVTANTYLEAVGLFGGERAVIRQDVWRLNDYQAQLQGSTRAREPWYPPQVRFSGQLVGSTAWRASTSTPGRSPGCSSWPSDGALARSTGNSPPGSVPPGSSSLTRALLFS